MRYPPARRNLQETRARGLGEGFAPSELIEGLLWSELGCAAAFEQSLLAQDSSTPQASKLGS